MIVLGVLKSTAIENAPPTITSLSETMVASPSPANVAPSPYTPGLDVGNCTALEEAGLPVEKGRPPQRNCHCMLARVKMPSSF